ncbi:hypothetical protein [Nocardioides halotolerans]|jgi:hypothetical protein|uniref:hypothetical protein n=1 Tax=Nocardioides halotolerans TaxID=433660 RepID=UPI00040EB99C|nr:hypothetical protein [Nocardioides halotolerans]
MSIRSLVAATAAALAAGLLAVPVAAASPTAATASALAVQASPVPPGSYLAVVERGRDAREGGIDAREQRLVLVSPTGETRTIYQQPARGYSRFTLSDWSVDGSTALLVASHRRRSELVRVDVETGATTRLDVVRLNTAILDPAGAGVLATTWKRARSNTLVLSRISWAGETTRVREGVSGSMIAGPGGTVLTADVKRGRVQRLLSTSTGAVVSHFRGDAFCTPVRWWDAAQVLEMCGTRGDLHLVDPVAGTSHRLTSRHGRGDYGHLDARYAGGSLYVQAAGGCGYTFVAKVTKHSTRHLRVPHAVGSVVMVAAVGDQLVLEHAASCDGDRPRSVLSLFDPVRHRETSLVRLGRHEAFARILVLGEIRASAY